MAWLVSRRVTEAGCQHQAIIVGRLQTQRRARIPLGQYDTGQSQDQSGGAYHAFDFANTPRAIWRRLPIASTVASSSIRSSGSHRYWASLRRLASVC